jgi:hypothetical protein
MPLKNYTTEVPAQKSIGEIEKKLIAHGATSMLINYSDGIPESVSFIVPTRDGSFPFRLPSNVKAVEKLLLDMRARKPPESRPREYEPFIRKIREQALRVAWRIIRDWVDAQLAIIDTEMVDLQQVFLPYMLMQGGEHTLYEHMKDRGFLLPEGRG